MFRPNAAIIRFSSKSMVVVLYRIGMGMSRWWYLSICDVCYMLFLRGTAGRGGGSVMCAILGCAAQVCLLAAVLCGSPATVCPYPMSTAGGLFLWVLWRGEKPNNKSWCGLVCMCRWLITTRHTSHLHTHTNPHQLLFFGFLHSTEPITKAHQQ